MKVVHLLRKPCSEGTVAANVLRYGTGALNIDACRISATDAFGGGAKGTSGFVNGYAADGWVPGSPLGRWPANLVLQHLDGCVQDGTETVAAWACAEGCPVAALDEQSGELKSGVAVRHRGVKSGGYGGRLGVLQPGTPDSGFADTGGASRFFKQVKP